MFLPTPVGGTSIEWVNLTEMLTGLFDVKTMAGLIPKKLIKLSLDYIDSGVSGVCSGRRAGTRDLGRARGVSRGVRGVSRDMSWGRRCKNRSRAG